jgi:hypothetical protein
MRAEPLRGSALLAHDVAATIGGLCAALALSTDVPAGPTPSILLDAGLLLLVRIAAVMSARLHCWDFQRANGRGLLRLALAALVSSIVFASASRTLPPAVYVLEFFLTTTMMAAARFAPRVAHELREVWQARRSAVQPTPSLLVERPRRALNVLVAAVALVLTFPVWILIALAIKLTSPGPSSIPRSESASTAGPTTPSTPTLAARATSGAVSSSCTSSAPCASTPRSPPAPSGQPGKTPASPPSAASSATHASTSSLSSSTSSRAT